MSSDAELDAKLTALLRVMVSRLPPNKKLPSSVVVQLLGSKYGDVYSAAYLSSHEAFIAETIQRLSSEHEKISAAAAAAVTTPVQKSAPAASSSDDDDDDDDDEDSESDDDSEEGSSGDDEEASADEEDDDDDSEEDEEDSDGDDGSDEDADADEDDDGAPEAKKARADEVDAITRKQSEAAAGNGATMSTAERCKAMAECLRKLTYRVRAPTDAETLEEYLSNFLIPEFERHGMDPRKYAPSDVKRYRIQREVELLQQDGASLLLDRRHRAGRGFSHVEVAANGKALPAPPPPASTNKHTSMFLDDE